MRARTVEELETAVRSYVAAGSGLQSEAVIPGFDNGPAPETLYASVLLIHQDIQGVPVTVFDGGAEARTVATMRGRYSVQWFRRGARNAALSFAIWASSPEGREAADTRKLTYIRVSDIHQLDELVSEAWEQRAGLDLDLGYLQEAVGAAEYIERVPIIVAAEAAAGGAHNTYELEVAP